MCSSFSADIEGLAKADSLAAGSVAAKVERTRTGSAYLQSRENQEGLQAMVVRKREKQYRWNGYLAVVLVVEEEVEPVRCFLAAGPFLAVTEAEEVVTTRGQKGVSFDLAATVALRQLGVPWQKYRTRWRGSPEWWISASPRQQQLVYRHEIEGRSESHTSQNSAQPTKYG